MFYTKLPLMNTTYYTISGSVATEKCFQINVHLGKNLIEIINNILINFSHELLLDLYTITNNFLVILNYSILLLLLFFSSDYVLFFFEITKYYIARFQKRTL